MRSIRFIAGEILAWVAVYGVYLLTRSFAISQEAVAVANTHDLVAFEQATGLYVEREAQSAFAEAEAFFDGYYLVGFAPTSVVALVWAARRHREAYLRIRRAMFGSLLLAAPFFCAFPAAPPRLVESLGIADTIGRAELDSGSLAGIRFNPYAAMPSLHVGWSVLLAVCLARVVRRRGARALVFVHPVLMVVAVVVTGNHLVVDAVIGTVISLLALAAVPLADRTKNQLLERKDELLARRQQAPVFE